MKIFNQNCLNFCTWKCRSTVLQRNCLDCSILENELLAPCVCLIHVHIPMTEGQRFLVPGLDQIFTVHPFSCSKSVLLPSNRHYFSQFTIWNVFHVWSNIWTLVLPGNVLKRVHFGVIDKPTILLLFRASFVERIVKCIFMTERQIIFSCLDQASLSLNRHHCRICWQISTNLETEGHTNYQHGIKNRILSEFLSAKKCAEDRKVCICHDQQCCKSPHGLWARLNEESNGPASLRIPECRATPVNINMELDIRTQWEIVFKGNAHRSPNSPTRG